MSMNRITKLVMLVATMMMAVMAMAQESWFGFYVQGSKVGYIHYQSSPDPDNPKLTLRKSDFVFDAAMLGQPLKINVQSWSWVDSSGRLVKSRQLTDSAGRINDVTAEYGKSTVKATMVTSGDTTSTEIPIPEGAKILDDPVTELVTSGNPLPGTTLEAYVFAPESLTLQKIKILVQGKTKIKSGDLSVDATHVVVDDPRAKTELYFSAKGDLIKGTGPLGMEYRPEPKEVALKMDPNATTGDLALASSVPVTGYVDMSAPTARYRVTGTDLSNLPTDPSQRAKKEGNGFVLWVKPVKNAQTTTTIADSAKSMPQWVKPDVRVPSQSERFQNLAKTIIGSDTKVISAGQKLRKYINNLMIADAGIGVMRDANEILDSKQGVCRDYAILLGTLTKAAGIPTRFISGLVYTGRDFLYHAWVEVWDGQNWIGLDATRPADYVTAGHVKTAQGTVGDGLSGFLLDGAKFEVIGGDQP